MKSTRVLIWGLFCALVLISAAALMYSCSSGGGGSEADSSGTVAVYATGSSLDSALTSTSTGTGDTNLNTDLTSTTTGTNLDSGGTGTTADNGNDGNSLASRITATITRIELVHKGTGTSCAVLTEPVSLSIADLSNIMHLITEADCPAASYNRIHIEFGKNFFVEDNEGHESSCSLTSSNHGQGNQPNVLQCYGEVCSLDINGAVNVLVNQKNNVALNFNLKEFVVKGFGNSETCTVTIKTSPVCGSQGEMQGYPESMTGLVSHLSPSTQTFDLTKGHKTFTVLYSEITSSQQPGIDYVLKRAQDDRLLLNVLSSSLKPVSGVISASAVYMKVEGVVSGLDAEKGTCTITYRGGGKINMVYQDSANEGVLKDGAWVQVKITGYDGQQYIASWVGTGSEGSATDN